MIIPKIAVGDGDESDSAVTKNKEDPIKSSALIGQSVPVTSSVICQPAPVMKAVIGQPELVANDVIGQPELVTNAVIGQPELVTNALVGSSTEAVINNGSSAVNDRSTEVESAVMDRTLIARSVDASVAKDDNLSVSSEQKEEANKAGSGITGIAADSYNAGSAPSLSPSLSAGPKEKSVLKRTHSSQQSTRCQPFMNIPVPVRSLCSCTGLASTNVGYATVPAVLHCCMSVRYIFLMTAAVFRI